MANTGDPDQTSPEGTVQFWSALFAHTCVSIFSIFKVDKRGNLMIIKDNFC